MIATRDGNDAAACSLDFAKPPQYYDTFALRDISGAETVTQLWPFFLAAESRNAVISYSPVPVRSCWGLIVLKAKQFYDNPSLRFRGIPDSLADDHLEGSECCLIHADNQPSSQGIWLNPNVRVSYNPEAYNLVNPEGGVWPSRMEKVIGIWSNRWARWTGFPLRYMDRYIVGRRISLWSQREGHAEQSNWSYCVINERQILTKDGWKHD